ncbi:MAG: hypothetical protein LAT81_10705 [Oceanicaulis sp.]|nr:hypothetical protein [Oceanicaulis sp.]
MFDELIEKVSASGGSERANYQLFVIDLCDALGLDKPAYASDETRLNDYVFERRVDFVHPDGSRTPGFIDCYKRDHFVLEAKQSKKRIRPGSDEAPLFPDARAAAPQGRRWDQIMIEARKQAENYARALPVEHGYPPFLIVVDVGKAIELFADFSGQGKNYAHFPDRKSYRIGMEDLRDPVVQERLRLIWTDPHVLDPARISAEVTRDIAARLARIAKRLEGRHDPKDVAEFLMRCLFTMFAEDVDLLPGKSFCDLLETLVDRPDQFVPALESLWSTMDQGGYEPRMMAMLKRFNGALFKDRRALPLERDDIHELWIASKCDWRDVEPAIFGTLLERALNPRERSKLGAHYTPRAYVERLVIPTIIEPLRDEWEAAQARVQDLRDAGDHDEALETVKAFHHRLCTVRVLDPACGTGNFLYVSLELMKRLEGEVLEALESLGDDQARLALEGETVSPRQFHGLEINPRAVPIADLVLWIGFLKWQLRTAGLSAISEPVLHAYGTIRQQDAIITYDEMQLVRDDEGKPRSRWDGVTYKLHPITGEEIPDPDARVEVYSYRNPKPAPWPEVEFIVGNPPFIGGKDMRAELGDGYAEACWKARPHLPGGADFVMHFWDEAATRLLRKGTKTKPTPLMRFGFITTNSITQTFSRRVIERHLAAKEPLSLIYAIPDHPWLKASDKAAVRIAMTVAAPGTSEGVLAEVTSEDGLNTDTPQVELKRRFGIVRANLRLGADLSLARPLIANDVICSPGVKLHGAGFIVTPQQAISLGLGRIEGIEENIREYRNGRDLASRPRGVKVIDLYPLDAETVSYRFPAVYQHVLERVKPERDQNNMKFRRENWWWFGATHRELRAFLEGLPRYIATIETAKHRFFQFLDGDVRPDNMLIAIGDTRAETLSVLSSRLHVVWALQLGGWLGVGNDARYSKTRTFDPFPFPTCLDPRLPDNHPQAALRDRLRDLGERLDAFRKERIAAHSFLTMTGLYNALERLRELEAGISIEPLTDEEQAVHEAGLISVLAKLHDDIDAAVLEAYGLEDLISDLVGKPGATTPAQFEKPAAQAAAEEALLARLVELNVERKAEEERGIVHWLRPDFQIPRLRHKVPEAEGDRLFEDVQPIAAAGRPKWPTDGLEQIRIVRDIVIKAPSPAPVDAIAASFDGRLTAKRRSRVENVLATLVATGAVREGQGDAGRRYFAPR